MATTLSDIIIPEVFADSIIEETTLRDSFLQSGVLAPLPELNLSSTAGGNFVNIPFYKEMRIEQNNQGDALFIPQNVELKLVGNAFFRNSSQVFF